MKRGKKKLWKILISIVGVILVLIIVFIGVIAYKGLGISQGIYLEAKNEHSLVILNNSPIRMSARTGIVTFENLETGDEILVFHGGIAESYPGQTGVYAIYKLHNGSPENVPQHVIEQLTELGWLE